jgi:hypothetical protein
MSDFSTDENVLIAASLLVLVHRYGKPCTGGLQHVPGCRRPASPFLVVLVFVHLQKRLTEANNRLEFSRSGWSSDGLGSVGGAGLVALAMVVVVAVMHVGHKKLLCDGRLVLVLHSCRAGPLPLV